MAWTLRAPFARRASIGPFRLYPSVRAALLDQQRRIASEGDYVIEGRDIGTVVFPNAEVKIFLTASDEARARRRAAQNEARGIGSTDLAEVLVDICMRDEADESRAAAPLVQADDAVAVDSSDISVDEVIDRICALAAERGSKA